MTLIDTAEVYGSEEFIGRMIAGQRNRVFLVSKVWPSHVAGNGITRACEATVAKSDESPEDVAKAIADRYAAAVEFPTMMFADDAPIGLVAQRMVDGRFDKAFLISEIERFTGVKVDSERDLWPGHYPVTIAQRTAHRFGVPTYQACRVSKPSVPLSRRPKR